MAKHKFAVGDRVKLLSDKNNMHVSPGIYTIVRVMPVTNQGLQYRAKNMADDHERVLDENELRAV